MHRQPLLLLLARYASTHPGEAAVSSAFRRFVESEPACFERTLSHGHLTGSAWISNHSGDAVLLTHHAKLEIWVQLGGHADGDPDLLAVALREAHEESGLPCLELVSREIFDLDIHPIPARRGEPAHLHYDVRFVLRHPGGQLPVASAESRELAWVPLDQLTGYTREPGLMRMRAKWLSLPRAVPP